MLINLLDRFKSKNAVIGVIGMGYVGLPLALRFAEEKFTVLGFDIDRNKVNALNSGKSYMRHIPSHAIQKVNTHLRATTDFSLCSEADALIICVPTPLNKHREPDLSYVLDTTNEILKSLKKGQLVSLESTTYPGTTDEVVLPILEKSGLRVGQDFFLTFSPEREDPGNPSFSTYKIPKICGGITENCLKAGLELYGLVIESVVPVTSTRVAEMTKLLENIHRAVNIGLVNEIKIVADRMKINIHEVIRAAATKPFGFTPFYPGPGLGGHCIPIDPFYLTWKAREYGLHTRFIELAGEVNSAMPHWVVDKIVKALNDRSLSVKDSKILVLGVAYKKNIDDMRESPGLEILDLLRDLKANLAYSDPYIPVLPRLRRRSLELSSTNLSVDVLKSFDCVVLVTNHDGFDYDMISRHAKLIVDTRGCFGPGENVVQA
jgi:UDP-N-acetyl-D-glucosamine dehydrogenase